MNLRDFARGQECQVRLPGICNFDVTTTVLGHLRLAGISGMGLKVPDILGAHTCSACHAYVDTHHDTETKVAFYEGIFRTICVVFKRGILKW